jgi:hypothetical protein
MKISEKQIMQLILIAHRLLRQLEGSWSQKEPYKQLGEFLLEITDQQSDELREVE